MGRTKDVTSQERLWILDLVRQRLNAKQISIKVGRCVRTIRNVKNTAYIRCQRTKTLGSGRKSTVTPQIMRIASREIYKAQENHEIISVPQIIKSSQLNVSPRSLNRALKSSNISCVTLVKKPILSQATREKRFNFAKKYINWDWSKVLFSDEKKFRLDIPDGNLHTWRFMDESDERFIPMYNAWRRQMGGSGTMVWGSMCYYGMGSFCFTDIKLKSEDYGEILKEYVKPVFTGVFPQLEYYQHDNAPIHVSNYSKGILNNLELQVIEWPPSSADINPIENIWSIIQQRIYTSYKGFVNKESLVEAIEREWDNITVEICQNLINSINARLIQVLQRNGGHTDY